MEQEINTEVSRINNEVTLVDLFRFIKKNSLVALITAIIVATATYFAASYVAVSHYTYSCSFMVETYWNASNSEEILSPSGATNAVSYATMLIETQKDLLQGSDLLDEVVADAGYSGALSASGLRSLLSVTHKEDTFIINASITSQNNEAARNLIESYAKLAPSKSKILSYSSLVLTEAPRNTGYKTTPVNVYTIIAFFLSGIIVLLGLYFIESLDTRVKSASEVERKYNLTNLGVIPNFYVGGGKNYKAYKKGARAKNESYYYNNTYY